MKVNQIIKYIFKFKAGHDGMYTPIISSSGRWKEDQEFKDRLSYIMSSGLAWSTDTSNLSRKKKHFI